MSPESTGGDPAPFTASDPPSIGQADRRRKVIALTQRVLFGLGCVALGAAGSLYLTTEIYQVLESRGIDRALGLPGAAPLASVETGGVIGRIEVPRLGISAVIREGLDSGTLLLAVGHLPGSAQPGEEGNVVVGGHRDTFFRGLKGIRKNDTVRIVTRGGSFLYLVDQTVIVTPDHTELLDRTDHPTLTLITCYPFSFIGSAPKRFIVRARQS
ncbi:MAG TPA: class D sortase [Candidatus Polarisedimenticolia bacterium]|jgi:sortase A